MVTENHCHGSEGLELVVKEDENYTETTIGKKKTELHVVDKQVGGNLITFPSLNSLTYNTK